MNTRKYCALFFWKHGKHWGQYTGCWQMNASMLLPTKCIYITVNTFAVKISCLTCIYMKVAVTGIYSNLLWVCIEVCNSACRTQLNMTYMSLNLDIIVIQHVELNIYYSNVADLSLANLKPAGVILNPGSLWCLVCIIVPNIFAFPRWAP